MSKYIIIFLGLLIVAGCTPQPIPGPDGAQGPPGTEGTLVKLVNLVKLVKKVSRDLLGQGVSPVNP